MPENPHFIQEKTTMLKSITDALEKTTSIYGENTIACSESETCSYRAFTSDAQRIGSFLLQNGMGKKKIAIFIEKNINCLRAMFGSAYANACYTVLDVNSSVSRLSQIICTLQPECVIVDKESTGKWPLEDIHPLEIETMLEAQAVLPELEAAHRTMCDTDPLYILFTSGSTGVPKGTVVCHRSVIAYCTSVIETFGIDETTVWGSQTPLYFSMSILDVFTTVMSGATYCIIPRMYFSFPALLMQYLNEKRVNSIYWVPSALGIVANFRTFDAIRPEYLKLVLFAGEVMPVKQLNVWRRALPDVCFANLYGPTEITDTCTYFVVDRDFDDRDSLPIGIPFDNCDVLVIKENGGQVLPGEKETGELCVRGSFLGLGYYNNPEKTAKVFTQNPLNTSYPELIYHTGDLVSYNDRNELVYYGRKDFQVKHMGYRIELGEIEANINAIEGINECACVYVDSQIVLFYQAPKLDVECVRRETKERLVSYMQPTRIICLPALPHNANGKIDRKKLEALLNEEK